MVLVGCGNSVKSEKELSDDLAAHLSLGENSQISELTIIKRLTNDKDRTDKVYVQATLESKYASIEQAYVMDYTKYNDGWRLDDATEYHNNDASWNVQVKGKPSDEDVLNSLILYSNYQGQMNSNFCEKFEPFYFFEEDKYSISVNPSFINPQIDEYSCVVEINRLFDHFYITEKVLLDFTFNYFNYEWLLMNAKFLEATGNSDYSTTWYSPELNFSITLGPLEKYWSNTYGLFDLTMNETGETIPYGLTFAYPTVYSSYMGTYALDRLGYGSGEFYLEMTPNAIAVHNTSENKHYELLPIGESPDKLPQLERTGIIQDNNKYQEYVKDVISAVIENDDYTGLKDAWDSEGEQPFLNNIPDIKSELMGALIYPGSTQFIEKSDDSEYYDYCLEFLTAKGFQPDEIVVCSICIREDYDFEYASFLIVNEGGKMRIAVAG